MLSPKYWPRVVRTLYRTFGARGIVLRAVHEARRAVGAFRAAPRYLPSSCAMPDAAATLGFAVNPERLAASTDRDTAVARAERVLAGEYQAYRWSWRQLPRTAAEWLVHPLTGRAAPGNVPWWRVAHLDAAAGDIKDLWEPARFAWAYDLVRGYLLTRDDRFARAFHDHLAAWYESSPPFRGPHWSCGQETAIRAAAILYAEANLASAPSSTPEAMRRIERVLSASGERIRDALGYAISQRNNHAISEAAGLILLGVRMLSSHPEAQEWLATGHRLLERLIREQFAEDGWYVQHSFTYLRLALDQCVLAERALRRAGRGLSPVAVARLRAAVNLLLTVMEPESGIVPNHGPNDGAFVHPVTLADCRDFRPVITAVCALWQSPLPANIAPDPEVLAWLGEEAPPVGPPLEDGVWTGASGWAVVRTGGTAVFLRAGSYTSRPGHIDPLHLDVRFDGREVIVDPGTFAYNAPEPWRNGLAGAAVHNGPLVDGREPGIRGPRFLWYLWPEARILTAERIDAETYELIAEIPGEVRRVVRVGPGIVTVDDQVLRPAAREATVRWLLHPNADPAQIEVEEGKLEPAREGEVVGWFSPGYGVRIASRAVSVCWAPGRSPVLRTVIRAEMKTPQNCRTAEGEAPPVELPV